MPTFTVIICTLNPRAGLLERTLAGLRHQTLAPSDWDLLIIDNGSDPPLAGTLDIRWHPNAHVITENQRGLTIARLRGIAAAETPLLVFVDDDNILAPTYLENASRVANEWPLLGAWGGAILPEYQSQPDPKYTPWYSYLAIRDVTRDAWGNGYDISHTPWGAGMVVRHAVAEMYAANIANNGIRKSLGRSGASLSSSEDIDLAWTSIDCGLGVALFRSLSLRHIIPAFRLEPQYLLRLCEGTTESILLLRWARDLPLPSRGGSLLSRSVGFAKWLRMKSPARQFAQAYARGQSRAWKRIDALSRNAQVSPFADGSLP
jgi:glycosyltransferase involved in cell wall biosynthesis